MAYTGKYFDQSPYRVYCLVGDGELAEGSNWEAIAFASHYKLNNFCAIFDINRLGQSEPTPIQHQAEVYKARVSAFGWHAQIVDGHDINAIRQAFKTSQQVLDRPQAIIAVTFKGRGNLLKKKKNFLKFFFFHLILDFLEIEDAENWHGKPLGDKADAILKSLKSKLNSKKVNIHIESPPFKVPDFDIRNVYLSNPPCYNLGDKVI